MKQFALIICLLPLYLTGQSILDLKVDVGFLASDMLEGRSSGTNGEQLASEYIAKRFADIGLTPKGDDYSWFQNFEFKESLNPHATDTSEAKQLSGSNVIGYLDNGSPRTIVIGAHYDHLGYSHSGSRYTGGEAIHNGADDNASGVASMIYVAEHLKKNKFDNYNYLFIAFSGEEYGLFGSKYFTKNSTIDLSGVACMINMDMVGRLNKENTLVINGAGTSPVWKPLFEEVKEGLNIQTTDSGIGPSDHTSFYLVEIPAIHLFTGQHMDYHKPSDDAMLVNYSGLEEISEFIIRLVDNLDPSSDIEFTKTKDNTERTAARFKVSLGVMPDYTYSKGDGMRIDGVIEGRAAEKAGMENGDLVIMLGELEVKDIYDYMEALSKFKAGDKTKAVIKRGSKSMEVEVVF